MEIRIVGLTVYANLDVERVCIGAGMNDVLNKPIETAAFYAAIDRRLRDVSKIASQKYTLPS